MRKFVHKQLWWCAIKSEDNLRYSIDKNTPSSISNNTWCVPKELIEWNKDREEVVETKDWIDNFMDEIDCQFDWDRNDLRKILEKHAPKVKKINEKHIAEYYNDWPEKYVDWKYRAFLGCFLQDHWLLEE
jgi:hypothetical protein